MADANIEIQGENLDPRMQPLIDKSIPSEALDRDELEGLQSQIKGMKEAASNNPAVMKDLETVHTEIDSRIAALKNKTSRTEEEEKVLQRLGGLKQQLELNRVAQRMDNQPVLKEVARYTNYAKAFTKEDPRTALLIAAGVGALASGIILFPFRALFKGTKTAGEKVKASFKSLGVLLVGTGGILGLIKGYDYFFGDRGTAGAGGGSGRGRFYDKIKSQITGVESEVILNVDGVPNKIQILKGGDIMYEGKRWNVTPNVNGVNQPKQIKTVGLGAPPGNELVITFADGTPFSLPNAKDVLENLKKKKDSIGVPASQPNNAIIFEPRLNSVLAGPATNVDASNNWGVNQNRTFDLAGKNYKVLVETPPAPNASSNIYVGDHVWKLTIPYDGSGQLCRIHAIRHAADGSLEISFNGLPNLTKSRTIKTDPGALQSLDAGTPISFAREIKAPLLRNMRKLPRTSTGQMQTPFEFKKL